MTFDGLLLPDMLQHAAQAPVGGINMWDASKLADFPHGLGGLATSQPLHASDYLHQHACELGYSAPALSQAYGVSLPPFSDYQQASQSLQFAPTMHDVQMPTYPAVSAPQQTVPAPDAALLQILQSQLAAANLLASQTQVGAQLPLQAPLANAMGNTIDFLATQGQYYDLLNQASLQAVQSVLQQRLMSTQQLTMLQQLLKQEAQAAPKQAKRNNGNHRNASSGKHRNGSRHGGRKGSVAQQAPSWADHNWDPLSNVQAKAGKEQQGTGVFLPQGLPELTNETANDQMSEASSDQSSGCAFDMLGRQES